MKKYLLLAIIGMTVGCTSTINKKPNIKTAKEDIAAIKEKYKDEYAAEDFEQLSNELTGTLFRSAMSGDKDMSGVKFEKTYKEYLDDAKSKRLEYDKNLVEYNGQIATLKKLVSMRILDKAIVANDEYGVSHSLGVRYEVICNSDKEIKGFSGTVVMNDMFDKEITKLSFEVTDPIKKGEQKTIDLYYKNIDFDDALKNFANTDISKMKLEWQPDKMLYADGSSDQAPPSPVK